MFPICLYKIKYFDNLKSYFIIIKWRSEINYTILVIKFVVEISKTVLTKQNCQSVEYLGYVLARTSSFGGKQNKQKIRPHG